MEMHYSIFACSDTFIPRTIHSFAVRQQRPPIPHKTNSSMSEAGIEPSSPVFEWFNTVCALKRLRHRGRNLSDAFMNITSEL